MQDVQYATFFQRLMAYIFDGTLIFLVEEISDIGLSILPSYIADWIFIILLTIAIVKFDTGKWQGTPGKRLLKIFIIDADSQKSMSYMQATVRLLSPVLFFTIATEIISYLFYKGWSDKVENSFVLDGNITGAYIILFLLFAWYLTALFTKEKKAVHDMICKTRVICGVAERFNRDKKEVKNETI